MNTKDFHRRLDRLTAPLGADSADLRVGGWTVRLTGMDRATLAELGVRWGPFIAGCGSEPPTLELSLVDAGREEWLGGPSYRGERYRIESHGGETDRIVVSHNFALDLRERCWRLAITGGVLEPIGRIVENAARLALARLSMDENGFAMHAAGVLYRGKAWIYCGPSRSGKSTAVAASAPAKRLGDDFAVVVRRAGGWMAPSLPFDSAETVEACQPQGEFQLAAVVRLYHGDSLSVDRPGLHVASASLLACAAFPWIFPERAGELLDRVRGLISEIDFAHVHFALDSNLHRDLLAAQDEVLDSTDRPS